MVSLQELFTEKEVIPGGKSSGMSIRAIAKKHDKKGYYHIDDMVKIVKAAIKKGIKVEMEHTTDPKVAAEIARDHVAEDLRYYDKLKTAGLEEFYSADEDGAQHFHKSYHTHQDIYEETDHFCPQCLAEYILNSVKQPLQEATYKGRTVPLGKPMKGDVKKFKVYVKNAKGNVVKVNFGQKGVKIKKNNPKRRKSFRARHHCDTNPGPRWKARYWSCRKW